VTWHDERLSHNWWDIYAQHVDANGNQLWATDGLTVCDYSGDQRYPVLATDGSGGAIVAWSDGRIYLNEDIYAERLAEYHTAINVPLVMKLD